MPELNPFISPSEWSMTDDDCLQFCRAHPAIDPDTYELVQINSFPGHVDGKPFYQVSRAHIDMKDYTDEEILSALNAYGYEDMDDFVFQNAASNEFIYKEDGTLDRENSPSYIIEYQLIAEMLFELEAQEYTEGEYETWNEAVSRVGEITGEDLHEYFEEEKSLDPVQDSLVFGERETGDQRTAFITTPTELAELFNLDREQLVKNLLDAKSSFGKSVYAIYEKDGSRFFLRIAENVSENGKASAAYIAASMRNGRYSNFEMPSAQTNMVLSHLLTPLFEAGLSDAERTHNIMACLDYAKENPRYIKDLEDIFTSFKLLSVSRDRRSVTQGEAVVFCPGANIVRFGDDMWLKTKGGDFSNGFRTVTRAQHYGPVIGGWGSIQEDGEFIRAALFQYPARIRQALSAPALSVQPVQPLDAQIAAADSKRAATKKNTPAKLQSIEPER